MLRTTIALATLAALCAGCGPATTETVKVDPPPPKDSPKEAPKVAKEDPPPSGEARDIAFPPIVRSELPNGLEVNTVRWSQLPVVYIRLVIKSGDASDPKDLEGLASLVASMLEEGTRKRTSTALAEEVEFLGADVWTQSDEETVQIGFRALSEHLEQALDIVSDMAMNPVFRPGELKKLKKRELDRLSLQEDNANFLASRELHRALYGDHPYAHIDTTPKVVKKVSRGNLVRWHKRHFVPSNAALVVVGDTDPEEVKRIVGEKLGKWRGKVAPEPTYADPPKREARQVLVVDRPESVQSVIGIANLAIPRGHADWVPLKVANQVLGGSAASRLFMDLREKRSLTYGAYSWVSESVQVAPFTARASVRNEVTGHALDAFFEHLDRITTEAPPEKEVEAARRYLSDSFPLKIDTPGKIAGLVADLRVFGLPDDYWESYRSRIGKVTAEEALTAAKAHIRPDTSLVVVVGRAADVVQALKKWGPVTVIDGKGKVLEELPADGAPEKEAEAAPEG